MGVRISATALSSFFVLLCVVVCTVGVGTFVHPPLAFGEEYRATVVDEETGQPLLGVVVFAVWNRRYAGPAGWAGGGYYASEETETGPAGQFVLKGRPTWTFLPFITRIEGPEFTFYLPGYGTVWGFQGSSTWPTDVFARQARVEEQWKHFRGEGTVITLPRLSTHKERIDALAFPFVGGDVPKERIPKLLDAVKRERAALGLDQ